MSDMVRMQNTLAKPAIIEGFGFWTGQDIRVEIRPTGVGSGLTFVRDDLPGKPMIPVSPECRVLRPRQTSLAFGDAQVDMVEHLLAALYGLQIDNCEIHVDAAEMPGLDGSSQHFVAAILRAGIIIQPAIRPKRVVYKNFKIGDDEHWIEAKPSFNGQTSFIYHLDYGKNSPIKQQSFRYLSNPENFILQLMSCRTFLTKEEADQLIASGKCQRVSPRDVLVFNKNQVPIDNILLHQDECARHKVLDMLGDFSLGGCDWVGEFVAYRSGHHLNVDCVNELLKKTILIEKDAVVSHTDSIIKKN